MCLSLKSPYKQHHRFFFLAQRRCSLPVHANIFRFWRLDFIFPMSMLIGYQSFCPFNSSFANRCFIFRRFSCCVVTALAFRSSAKLRMLCSMDVNPSSFGSHQRAQEESWNISANFTRRLMGCICLEWEVREP